ncbi:hypothetical protein HNY73_008771 [Argiope bruennichi]|uniref:Uncharacterized protein n=1 Tax=Argiope bruennichi TaxID=94029 RepID=A0A8T0F7G6_ARGBR|nr:hypothetical protein HNY73_008771 [Argiope bruennichi]
MEGDGPPIRTNDMRDLYIANRTRSHEEVQKILDDNFNSINFANRSTPSTTSNSRSSTPTSTRQIPTENPRSPQPSPQIPNSDLNMESPISQKQKNFQDDFQPVPSKKAAKKPRTEENFKLSTENAFSHLLEESDKTSKTPETISLGKRDELSKSSNILYSIISTSDAEEELHREWRNLGVSEAGYAD